MSVNWVVDAVTDKRLYEAWLRRWKECVRVQKRIKREVAGSVIVRHRWQMRWNKEWFPVWRGWRLAELQEKNGKKFLIRMTMGKVVEAFELWREKAEENKEFLCILRKFNPLARAKLRAVQLWRERREVNIYAASDFAGSIRGIIRQVRVRVTAEYA